MVETENPNVGNDPQVPQVEESAPEVTPKKQVNPVLALVLILAILGAVYLAYNKLTEDRVYHMHIKRGQ